MDRKYRLLIVEDEDSQRQLYAEYFMMQGFDVVTAEDGENALKLLDDGTQVDLILLDLMLPKIDGMRVLEHIRNDHSKNNVIVYLMTVLGTDAMIKNAFSKGADGYIVKDSITPEQIKNEIMSALKKKNL